ncbi:hypothetical protein ISCGN_000747 [Ixodes scapularis]
MPSASEECTRPAEKPRDVAFVDSNAAQRAREDPSTDRRPCGPLGGQLGRPERSRNACRRAPFPPSASHGCPTLARLFLLTQDATSLSASRRGDGISPPPVSPTRDPGLLPELFRRRSPNSLPPPLHHHHTDAPPPLRITSARATQLPAEPVSPPLMFSRETFRDIPNTLCLSQFRVAPLPGAEEIALRSPSSASHNSRH